MTPPSTDSALISSTRPHRDDRSITEAILRDRQMAYLLVDQCLQIDEIYDPFGLFAGNGWARPGARVIDLVPELIGSEDTLSHVNQARSSRWELDFVNRTTPAGDTAYWKLIALPRPSGASEANGLILLVEDVSELGTTHQHLMQNYNRLLLVQRELAETNLQLAAANAELRNLAEMKSVFVSVAAHELRNPLATILGYADIVLEGTSGSLTAKQREALEIVKHSSIHLLEITNNLLDLARIELGRMDLFLQPLALGPLIRAVVRELQPQLDARTLHVQLSIAPDLPFALADETRAYQILRNLASNAHKYTPPGGDIQISLGMSDIPDELLVVVKDTGVGIPAEDQSKLFSRFFRASNARQTGAAGTGLGLHITRLLVELHGGRIWFESSVGAGTAMYVSFPVADDNEPTTP
jgi:signal transduction histidine kinase